MTRLRLLTSTLACAAIAFVVWRAEPAELWATVRHVDPGWLAAVLFLNLAQPILYAARSFLVLQRLGYRLPWRVLVPATLLGNVAGSLTPAASGEVLRANALRATGGVRLDDSIA